MVREQAMPLLTSRLANHAELHHVLQSPRYGWRRNREQFRRRWDRDDRLALKVQVNPKNRSGWAAKFLNFAAIFFDEREYLSRCIGCLLRCLLHPG